MKIRENISRQEDDQNNNRTKLSPGDEENDYSA